jgi:hypothetical protein
MGNILTSDRAIRLALKAELQEKLNREYASCPYVKIIEELGVAHGIARVDLALVNGVIHGYELKSDLDTLDRLPWQIRIYEKVFDRVTLVVGKKHLHRGIEMIPEWWGVVIAKISDPDANKVSFYEIRKARKNPRRDDLSFAKLLWRQEALEILEERGEADGVRSKNRRTIYDRLIAVLSRATLGAEVRKRLCTREGWRSGLRYSLSDG